MTVEDYRRALEELEKREGLTDEQRQDIRNRNGVGDTACYLTRVGFRLWP